MPAIRPAAVAGVFYSAAATELRSEVVKLLGSDATAAIAQVPKTLIAPDAGYIYSGPVAAAAYRRLAPAREHIRRVVLLGPSHYVGFHGLVADSAEAWQTPLGTVPIDRPLAERLIEAKLIGVLDAVWGGPETLIVVSTDFSHYLDYRSCQETDRRTAEAIERLDPSALEPESACGRVPVRGLLAAAKRRSMSIARLDLRNSGDTAGSRDRVVDYSSWALFEPSAQQPTEGG